MRALQTRRQVVTDGSRLADGHYNDRDEDRLLRMQRIMQHARPLRSYVCAWAALLCCATSPLAQVPQAPAEGLLEASSQSAGSQSPSKASTASGAALDPVIASQAPAGSGEATGDEAGAPVREAYDGLYAEGMGELVRLAESGEGAAALEVAEELLVPNSFSRLRARAEGWSKGASEWLFSSVDAPLGMLGFETMTQAQRGEVHYAKGVVYSRGSQFEAAIESLDLARAETGPGETRLDAIYGLGTIKFIAGEVLRATIPEISGQAPGAGPQGGPPSGPAGAMPFGGGPQAPGQPEAPDPIELARAAYSLAKNHFVERLQADWQDSDTRANLELCLRRLTELDEIERKREEEEQQQDQQGDEQQEDSESDDQEESEESSENEEEQQSDSEKQDEEEKEGEESEEPEDQDPKEEEGAQKSEPKEIHLTEEEMKRLLDRLQEIDETGEEKRKRLRGLRRIPVQRDW
ncbi:MAG: hypothetical protein ACI841_000207 [Planctomycetota bacterium]|jgi:hypothetical protein